MDQLAAVVKEAGGASSKSRHSLQRRIFHSLHAALNHLRASPPAEVQKRLTAYDGVLTAIVGMASSKAVVTLLADCYVALYERAKSYSLQSKLGTLLDQLTSKGSASASAAQRLVISRCVGALFEALPKACKSFTADVTTALLKQLKAPESALKAATVAALVQVHGGPASRQAMTVHNDIVRAIAKVASSDRSESVRREAATLVLAVARNSEDFSSVGLEPLIQICIKGE